MLGVSCGVIERNCCSRISPALTSPLLSSRRLFIVLLCEADLTGLAFLFEFSSKSL